MRLLLLKLLNLFRILLVNEEPSLTRILVNTINLLTIKLLQILPINKILSEIKLFRINIVIFGMSGKQQIKQNMLISMIGLLVRKESGAMSLLDFMIVLILNLCQKEHWSFTRDTTSLLSLVGCTEIVKQFLREKLVVN